MSKKELIFGVGINDLLGHSNTPEWKLWYSVIRRCYSPVSLKKRPTYIGKTVSDDWLYFSKFRAWMMACNYNYDGWHLDKDLLVKGNTVYSAETCVFIPRSINQCLTKRQNDRGSYPIGVSLYVKSGKYNSRCMDGKGGHFRKLHPTIDEAFLWYKEKKESVIKGLAEDYKELLDPRAYQALIDYKVEITD